MPARVCDMRALAGIRLGGIFGYGEKGNSGETKS